MKRQLIATAALALAGAASAQTGLPPVGGVQIFGLLDAAVSYGRAEHGYSKTQLSNSAYASSRLGFRGTEDLGGGLSASFWMELGVNNDDGSGQANNTNNQTTGATPNGSGLTFNRTSWISLNGNSWGTLRLGRDYSPQFTNLVAFDPFTVNGVGTSLTFVGFSMFNPAALGPYPASTAAAPSVAYPGGYIATRGRSSNGVAWLSPFNSSGFYGWAQYYMGENVQTGAATQDDGTGWGLRGGWKGGPFNVALAVAKTQYSALGDFRTVNIGGSWNLDVVTLMAQYNADRAGGTTLAGGIGPNAIDAKGWLLGAVIPVGPHQIRASYSTYQVDRLAKPESKKLAVGYAYNFSPRTALYATLAYLKNSNGANSTLNGSVAGAGQVNFSSVGYDIGLKHSF